MKKLFALILTAAFILSLASCSLVRKIEKTDSTPDSTSAATEQYSTDFSDTIDSSAESGEVRCTEEEAYAFLDGSLKLQYPNGGYSIEKTGDMTAQSNGSEYYIFNVTPPKSEEDKSAADSGENGATPYYVSVNGVIYTSLEENNATVKYAEEAFIAKHGETDAATGFAYKLEYQGTVKNNGVYCYNFIVYLQDTSGGQTKLTYKTNFIVSLDGHSSGEQAIEN